MAGSIEITGLSKRYGDFSAVEGVDLKIDEGTFVSLLGPSGCGKTTTLRMLAGFIDPTGGAIRVDGEVVSSADFVQPPEDRHMGMVFQSYAVWPHMTVFDNIAYGLRYGRKRETDRAMRQRRVGEALELVGLAGQERKFPNALSGGQQQRVALARALIAEPRILLLDEPLSNLDAKLRESMRFELRSLQRRLGITTVFVTHSQEEALLLSDTIVIMKAGRIIEQNAPEHLYQSPKTDFVADFIGLANFLEGAVVRRDGGCAVVATPIGEVICRDDQGVAASAATKVLIRPESIRIAKRSAAPDTPNTFPARILDALFNGSIVEYLVVTDGADIQLRVQQFAPRLFSAGEEIRVAFDPEAAKLVGTLAT